MDQDEMDESPSTSNLPAKGFFKLPRELPDLVYSYAVVARHENGGRQPALALKLQLCFRRCKREVVGLLQEDPTKWPEFTALSPSINVSLLCVSRQVNTEAEEVFYQENIFVTNPRFYLHVFARSDRHYSSLGSLLEENSIRRPIPAYASDQLTSLRCTTWWIPGSYNLFPDISDEAAIHEEGIGSQLGPLSFPQNTLDFVRAPLVGRNDRKISFLDSWGSFLCRIAALPNLRRLYTSYLTLEKTLERIIARPKGVTVTNLVDVVLGRVRETFQAREARGLPSVDVHFCGTPLSRLNDAHEWEHWSLLDCTRAECTALGE